MMMTQHISRPRATVALRSEADFDAMWREMAQTEQRVWSIAHEPLTGLFSTWEPRLELHEDDETYLLRATLPGIQRDDLRVEYRDGSLTIWGEQRITSAAEESRPGVQHGYRAFSRRFVLSEPVLAESLCTSYTSDGLEVSLLKAAAVHTTPALAAS